MLKINVFLTFLLVFPGSISPCKRLPSTPPITTPAPPLEPCLCDVLSQQVANTKDLIFDVLQFGLKSNGCIYRLRFTPYNKTKTVVFYLDRNNTVPYYPVLGIPTGEYADVNFSCSLTQPTYQFIDTPTSPLVPTLVDLTYLSVTVTPLDPTQ
ncbi:unnamed protein product [Caenorhabditis auriculariae]|uniref:CUB-like domain-containing protein n=1 Tax=Caenorhabditis auriculariae TaxID=2777116 RepID=A0A8S1H7Y2_9PELO|nr:unnamed protein product [Caenorhabditis auriculariae]